MQIIDRPEPADVLCGRGENSFRHLGNNRFRQLIVENACGYKTAATKRQKTQVVRLVADTIVAMGGRFLVRTDDGQSWLDGGLKQGKLKTGHAFRDALRGRVKCLAQYKRGPQASPSRDNDQSYAKQINDFTFKIETSKSLSLPAIYSTIEPSKDWMTASIDAELAKYLRNLFFLSEAAK